MLNNVEQVYSAEGELQCRGLRRAPTRARAILKIFYFLIVWALVGFNFSPFIVSIST